MCILTGLEYKITNLVLLFLIKKMHVINHTDYENFYDYQEVKENYVIKFLHYS